jgi:hypothetical protein
MPVRPISRRRPFRAGLERLEARLALSLSIQFDYSYDSSGFFTANPEAKAVLEEAAQVLGSRINDQLAAIVPNVRRGNVWSVNFTDPSTGQNVTVENPTIPANTIIVYAAGSTSSGFAGDGGPGGFSAHGVQAWNTLVSTRGTTGVPGIWGGMVGFNTSIDWGFANESGTPDANHYDFYSVALHELGHVLGIGTSTAWQAEVDTTNDTFNGPHAVAMNGGPVPLNSASDVLGEAADTHWASGLLSFGLEPSLDVTPLPAGYRKTFTSLDWAGLQDVGWHVDRAVVTTQPPATVAGGIGFGMTVSIEDPNGHLDTAYNGPVTAALAGTPMGWGLSGSLTVNAVNGVAAFSGLSIVAAGTGYQIQVRAPGLAPTTTASISVGTDAPPVPSPPIPAPSPVDSGDVVPPLSIVRVVAIYSRRGRRKKLIGFEVDFGSPLDGSTALNAANYTITETLGRAGRIRARRVRLRPRFGANTDDVRLIIAGNHPFAHGGRLVVSSSPVGGVSGTARNFLAGGGATFTILRSGKGVR